MKRFYMTAGLVLSVAVLGYGQEYIVTDIHSLVLPEETFDTYYNQTTAFAPCLYNGAVFYIDEHENLVMRNIIERGTTIVLKGEGDWLKIVGVINNSLILNRGGQILSIDKDIRITLVDEVYLTGGLYYHPDLGIYRMQDGSKKVLLRDKPEDGFGYSFKGSPVISVSGDIFVIKKYDMFEEFGTLMKFTKDSIQILREGVRGFGLLDDENILCSTDECSVEELCSEQNYGLYIIDQNGEQICDLTAILWRTKKELYLYSFMMEKGNYGVAGGAFLENSNDEERIWPIFTFKIVNH